MRSSLMLLASASVASAYTFCEMGVTTVTAGVAGTTYEVTKALAECADVSNANCTRDVTIAHDVYLGLVRVSPKVVGYCSGHSNECQSDVAHANAAITKASGPMNDAVAACVPGGSSSTCRVKLAQINAEMASAAVDLHEAESDCHTNKTSSVQLKGSKICEYEVDAVTAGIATTTEELAKSIKACSDITSANCSSNVATAAQMLTATRTAAAKGVTVCGSTTPCGEDVTSINGTLAKAQVPLAAAVTACKAGGDASVCHLKLASANAEVATAGLAAAKAHTDCKANATMVKSDVCKYEIALVSAGVAAAAEEVAKAVKICANITDAACADDVDSSKSIVDGLVPVVNRMVSGCANVNATCTTDVNAVKTSLDNAQAPIGKAADSCKAGGSAASCKIDLAGTSADLATAALDLSKAEKDCQ